MIKNVASTVAVVAGLTVLGCGAAQEHPADQTEARAAEANVYNSPGWKRLQARSGQRGMSQPRESRAPVIDLDAVSAFTEGDRVVDVARVVTDDAEE